MFHTLWEITAPNDFPEERALDYSFSEFERDHPLALAFALQKIAGLLIAEYQKFGTGELE